MSNSPWPRNFSDQSRGHLAYSTEGSVDTPICGISSSSYLLLETASQTCLSSSNDWPVEGPTGFIHSPIDKDICAACGTAHEDGANFCCMCGHALRTNQAMRNDTIASALATHGLPANFRKYQEECHEKGFPDGYLIFLQSHESQTSGPANCFLNPHQVQEKHNDTTMMIRNIPSRIDKSSVIKAMDLAGFTGLYEAVCLPKATSRRGKHKGYAFVRFKSPQVATVFQETFQDYQFPDSESTKRCIVVACNK